MKKLILIICSLFSMITLNAQPDNYYKDSRRIYLDSKESLSELPAVKLKSSIRTYRKDGRHYLEVKLKNTTGKLAFFTQLQLLDEADKPIRPSFYTDNFFSLLPNESKTIIIDTRMEDMPSSASFVIKGWNVIERNYVIMQNRYKMSCHFSLRSTTRLNVVKNLNA